MYSLTELLNAMLERKGANELAKIVRRAIDIQSGDRAVDDYLDFRGVRRLYRASITSRKREGTKEADPEHVIDTFKLADVLRRLHIPLELLVETAQPPWDGWPPGAALAVVLGARQVEVSKQDLAKRAVDEYDVKAHIHLVDWLGHRLGLEFRPEVHSLPSTMPADQAETELETLRKRSDVGAIIALGSPVTNPLADPLARKILDNTAREELPARFRFSFPLPGNGESYLAESGVCRPREEGIRVKHHKETTHRRISNDEAMQSFVTGMRGPFDDCGMLLLDCRVRPRLGLCAGHGGCGTLAAVCALNTGYYIATRLEDSRKQREWHVGPDRVFEVVRVKRKKTSDEPVDDFAFDEQEGWEFW